MTNQKRLAVLRIVVLISLAFRGGASEALGLGPLRLQSALGQPLHASVQILGPEAKSLAESCLRGRLLAPDGSEILRPDIEMKRRNGQTEIAFASVAAVEEPAVTLSVAITCAPEMHRDYQLLLDLRDGLPRVLAQDNDSAPATRNAAGSRLAEVGAGGAARSGGNGAAEKRTERRRKARAAGAMTAAQGVDADALAVSADAGETPPRARARGLPGARNVLKLSQADLDTGKKAVLGLRLSDALSSLAERGAADADDILAAKARFVAMLRGEDPVQAAQREIRGLRAQLQKPAGAGDAANPASVTAPALASAPAAVSPRKAVPAAAAPAQGKPSVGAAAAPAGRVNFWMVALGSLLLATMVILGLLLRGGAGRGKKSRESTPWWMVAQENASREEALLESARALAASRKPSEQPAGTDALGRMIEDDERLHRYVDRYVQDGGKNGGPDGRRIEPRLLAVDAEAAGGPTDATSGATSGATSRATTADTSARGDAAATSGLSFDAESAHLHSLRRLDTESVELVSDVMQEAEFWKMLNETQRAIDILETYCQGGAGTSPVAWLFLADLYLGNGDMARYTALQARFRRHFNVRMTDDIAAAGNAVKGAGDAQTAEGAPIPAIDSRSSLEEYPHLMQEISKLWGRQEVVAFLHGLLINRRDSPRQGFSLPVYREIMLLIDLAREREQEFA